MHSFIIHSADRLTRENQVLAFISEKLKLNLAGDPRSALGNFPDVFLVDSSTSIGIEEIRKLKSHLTLRPLSLPSKIALILSADRLTLEAQNSLLKTLEEPAPHTVLILELANPDFLLPTIISRCELVTVKKIAQSSPVDENLRLIIKQALTSGPGKRLNLANQITTKEQALAFFQNLLDTFREITRKNPHTLPILKSALSAHQALKANCNVRLVMEYYFLNLKLNKE